MKNVFAITVVLLGTVAAWAADVPMDAAGSSGGIAPDIVGDIIAGVLTALGGGGAGYMLGKGARPVRIENTPVDVHLTSTFATKEDLEKLEKRQGEFEADMRRLLRESEENSHQRMDTISEKLDQLIGLVRGMHMPVQPAPAVTFNHHHPTAP